MIDISLNPPEASHRFRGQGPYASSESLSIASQLSAQALSRTGVGSPPTNGGAPAGTSLATPASARPALTPQRRSALMYAMERDQLLEVATSSDKPKITQKFVIDRTRR